MLLRVPCAEVAITGFHKFLWNVGFFNLDGRMVDMESFACHTIDSAENLSPVEIILLRDNVAAHREHA
jgi:hypothetical protein